MTLSLIWPVLYYGWFVSEILILVLTHTRRGAGKISDRGSLVLLWGVIVTAITASTWVAKTMPHNMPGSGHLLGVLSVAVLAAGLAIRWIAVLSLGRSFSVNVAIHHDQFVYKKGLFRFVRHPSYLGLMIVFLALGIAMRNWLSFAIILLLPLAALLYRIHVEEAALTEAFGEEYADYCKVTKRLLPGVY